MDKPNSKRRSEQFVKNMEDKAAKTFPWLKTSLGSVWTVFWVIFAITIEVVVIIVPIILAILGIIFVVVVITEGGGYIDPSYGGFGRSKKNQDKKDNP